MLEKTTDPEFMRDSDSGALINTNVTAYRLHRERRRQQNTISDLQEEVSNIKTDLNEIKQLLSKIIENVSINR